MKMVSCNQQPNEDGDYVCGWDEGDDFCIGYHCEVCSISLCSPDCGDEYCARTRSPADREQTKCMLCAHPLEDEEYDTDLETWVKDGKKIEWDGWSFSYPCEECGIDPCDCTNYSAETFDAEKSEYGMICNCGNTSGWIVRSFTSQGQPPEGCFNTVYHIECPSCREYVITYQRNDSRKSPFKKNAEYNVEFNEWADQELMSHGKDISFKDWAQDEGMKHGNTEITEWAQHEDESHNARYGAEEHRFMIACGRCGWNFTDEYIKNNTDGNIRPMYGDHCSCGGMVKRYDFEPEAKPKGFFKKLFGKNAESNQFPSMHYGDHDSDVQEKYQEMLDEWDYDEDPPSIEEWIKEEGEYDRRLQEYEGTEEYRKAMEEMERRMQEDFNAEGKKRSGLLSEPFEGTSLDSGEWKGILTGFSIGLLGLFGYSKLRK